MDLNNNNNNKIIEEKVIASFVLWSSFAYAFGFCFLPLVFSEWLRQFSAHSSQSNLDV